MPRSNGSANRGGIFKSRIVKTQAQGPRPLGRNNTGNCPSLFDAAFATLRKLYFGEPTTSRGGLALCYATLPCRSLQSSATYPHASSFRGMGKCQDKRK